MDVFSNFGLRDTFHERTAPKFLALNVDFDGPGLDFLGSRKPAHEGIKERYPRKSRVKMAVDSLTVWIC